MIHERNTETFHQMLRDLSARVYAQDERLEAQNGAIATLSGQVSALQSQLAQLRAATTGSGPTG